MQRCSPVPHMCFLQPCKRLFLKLVPWIWGLESRARRGLVEVSSVRDGAKKQKRSQPGRAGQEDLVWAPGGMGTLSWGHSGPQPLVPRAWLWVTYSWTLWGHMYGHCNPRGKKEETLEIPRVLLSLHETTPGMKGELAIMIFSGGRCKLFRTWLSVKETLTKNRGLKNWHSPLLSEQRAQNSYW